MDNLLTDKDLETIARAHRRCGEMEVERTLGALRVRVSTCPASRAWSVPYLIRLERWRPGMYSTQYFDSAEALREEFSNERQQRLYLLICGKPRVRDGEKCRSRQEEKVRRKKNGGGKDVGHRTSSQDVPNLRRR